MVWNIGGKDTRIADLEEKIEQLSRDFGQHQVNFAVVLQDKDKDIKDLSGQLEQLRLQVSRHQDALQERDRDVKRMSEENRALNEIINDNFQSLEHLEKILNSVREDNAKLHGLNQRVCICLNEQGDVQSKQLLEAVEALENEIKTKDEVNKSVQGEFSKEITELSNVFPRVIKKTVDMVETELTGFKEDISAAKRQFQTHLERIKEDAMRSDADFEKRFPALTHASAKKKSEAPGLNFAIKKNLVRQSNFLKCYKIPFDKVDLIHNKYPNKQGVNEVVARVLSVKDKTRGIFTRGRKYEEKSILVVGATGAGKSTLIDAIINYVLDVRYEDNVRFQLVDLSEAETKKKKNQTVSQTDNITIYKIPFFEKGNIPFALNIIDTPGLCDTRGIKQDKMLVPKLETVLSSGHISELNAICFVSLAGKARLTDDQRYSFDKIITSFGKDMKDNILGLFTFDDGTYPKAMDAFREAEIGLAAHFKFNSVTVIEDKKEQDNVDKSILLRPAEACNCIRFQDFYDNCDRLFGTVAGLTPVSTASSVQVMKSRYHIEMQMCVLQNELQNLMAKKDEINQEKAIMEKYMADEAANKDFEAEVTVAGSKKEDLPQGTYVTNCRVCNHTCHEDCAIQNDKDKHGCWAMTDGNCRICQRKCHWKEHSNMPFKFVATQKTEKRKAADIEAKYKEALANQGKQKSVLEAMDDALKEITQKFQGTVDEIRECIVQLDSQALKTAATSSAAYIEQMIETEKMNQKEGYIKRIRELEEEKKNAVMLDALSNGGELGGVRVQGARVAGRSNYEAKRAEVAEGYKGGYDKHQKEISDRQARATSSAPEASCEWSEQWFQRKEELIRDAAAFNPNQPTEVISENGPLENVKAGIRAARDKIRAKADEIMKSATENVSLFESDRAKSTSRKEIAKVVLQHKVMPPGASNKPGRLEEDVFYDAQTLETPPKENEVVRKNLDEMVRKNLDEISDRVIPDEAPHNPTKEEREERINSVLGEICEDGQDLLPSLTPDQSDQVLSTIEKFEKFPTSHDFLECLVKTLPNEETAVKILLHALRQDPNFDEVKNGLESGRLDRHSVFQLFE